MMLYFATRIYVNEVGKIWYNNTFQYIAAQYNNTTHYDLSNENKVELSNVIAELLHWIGLHEIVQVYLK